MRKPIIPQGSQPEKGEPKESFATEPKSFGQGQEQIASPTDSHLFSSEGGAR